MDSGSSGQVSVLCCSEQSAYHSIPGLDLWPASRDAFYFTGSNPIIAHPPCQQWSKLRAFAKYAPDEKELAYQCLKHVLRNGGILEHPEGSLLWKETGLSKRVYSVDQSWFGYPVRKRTYLLFVGCKPLAYPIFGFQSKQLSSMGKKARSMSTPAFTLWLVNCARQLC